MRTNKGFKNMKKIFYSIIFFIFLSYTIVCAGSLYVSFGIVQYIENNVITVNGKEYFPVVEEVSAGNIAVGDRVKILYEANPKGRRYYHAIVKPEEDFPLREEISPA
jgi:uncharacterized protein YbbC (DUF1343 family)